MKTPLLFLLVLFSSFQIVAQGEANNWYFGRNAGLSFNTNPPTALLNGEINTLEGCSSISDTSGNLLFYTDGRTIWDRNHQIMPNADYFGGTGLHGDPSSTQSGLIVPHPTNPEIYFVFTVDEPHHQNANAYPDQGPADQNGNPLPNYEEGPNFTVPEEDDGFNNGFNFSVVDISLRNGLGDVVPGERNNHLITYDEDDSEEIKYQCSEKISAVVGEDCETIWVITHFIDRFYAFLIDEDGVNQEAVVSQVNPIIGLNGYRRNSIGYLKASPDGEKLIIAHTQTSNAGNSNGNVYLYDFDNATGEVSNPIALIQNIRPYGVEFSSDSKKAYATSSVPGQAAEIYQWDLDSTNIPNSIFIQSTNMPQATAMQLGPNGKIYIPEISQSRLNVINNPNELGNAMDYTPVVGLGALNLQGRLTTFGLPPFIQSIFTSRVDVISGVSPTDNTNLQIETELSVCDGESFNLGFEYETAATYQWFQNGEAIPNATSPFLEISIPENEVAPFETAYTLEIFPDSGECKLSGIANVIFGENPSINDASLTQCLTDFDNETAFFNLQNAENEIIENSGLAIEDVEFSYYLNLDDLEDENEITNINNFENTANPQELIVEVNNTETRCSSLVNLELIVADVEGTEEVNLFECDTDLNGFQEFDLSLTSAETNLTPTYFYTNVNDALQDENRINNINSFSNTEAYTQTIYFRTETNVGCGILGILNLRVNDLPFLFEEKEVFYCLENSPNTISISPNVPENAINNYEYFWPATGEDRFSIQVSQAGTYQVLVTEIATGCEAIQNIVVENSNLANFQVDINDGSETSNALEVIVDPLVSLGDYEFALENPAGAFQDSPVFSDLAPGFYDVFVRDKNGCGISRRTVGVVGIMQFFTPNNDGVNDYWNVLGLPSNQNAKVRVFDRFGKLLAEFMAQNNPGWDGTFNGKLMPNNDYWYYVELDDGRVLKGNFTLKR